MPGHVFGAFPTSFGGHECCRQRKSMVPKWVAGYAADARVKPRIGGDGLIPVEFDLVIGFPQQLRDTHVQPWRRLQAARAIEVCQATVLRNSVVDFRLIPDKLREIASRERRAGTLLDRDASLVHASTQLRHASARNRTQHQEGAGAAWTQGYSHDKDLSARHGGWHDGSQ